jgi:hypothetical protein
LLDASVVIHDAELAALNGGAGNYSGSRITLSRNGGALAEDVFSSKGNLSFTSGSAVLSGVTIGSVSNSAGALIITFNANATQVRVNEALSSMGYANSSDRPACKSTGCSVTATSVPKAPAALRRPISLPSTTRPPVP